MKRPGLPGAPAQVVLVDHRFSKALRRVAASISVGVVLLLALFSSQTRASTPQPNCPPTPAINSDFPDPSLLFEPPPATGAYVYGTNIMSAGSSGLLNVPVVHSTNGLKDWSAPIDALPHLPAWAKPAFTWAPAVIHHEGRPYRLYFTARYGLSGRPCIGVALSETPLGPFTPTDQHKPLVCPLSQGGAIDPAVFEDDDGGQYLLWKTDSNCCDGDPTIYLQKLSEDGLTLAGADLTDQPWLLPDADPLIVRDQPWEGRVIEAPTLRKHAGRYYLFYSGGDYATDHYAVGYAVASSIFGPYQKAPSPILTAESTGLNGPGGQDVVSDLDGETWITFHAWREARPTRYRALFFARLSWADTLPKVVLSCADDGARHPTG